MSLRWRLFVLMGLLALLPGVLAVVVTKQLIGQSLDLGLSAEIDRAVETGLRHSAQLYRSQRDQFRRAADQWVVEDAIASASVAVLTDALRARRPDGIIDSDHVELHGPRKQRYLVQDGDSAQESAAEGEAPATLRATKALPHGWELRLTRNVDAHWRADAAHLQQALQILRVAQNDRADLERSYWIPFLLIYGLTLLVGALGAWSLGRGITGPVDRLLLATNQVAHGDWSVKIDTGGPLELGQLSEGFNHMVRTLDAQSRSLVELEKMAGWREMARILAHEVKNPLTPIQLTVEEMARRYDGNDEKYRELLEECSRIVVEEVESLRNVVHRFREFSRPVELDPKSCDFNRLVGDVAALQRDLESTTALDSELGEVEVDADRMRQLLMNLAENARNVLGQAGGHIHFSTRRLGVDRVELRVEDNGPGIPEEERERVFEPYQSGRAGGLGLGMALAKGIVLAHHGEIHVGASTLGGAAIILELPLRQPTGGEFT